MKAVQYSGPGPARDVLKIVEIPDPVTGEGEVLVRVHSSGVNPSDVKSRSGIIGRKQPFDHIIPHSDGAGVIVAVGSGVDVARIGERVWIWNGQWKRPSGTAAELIALPSAQAVRLSDNVSFEAGACFGIPLLTAIQAIELSRAGAGDTILISGGAGAVAQYAIQIAKNRGSKVIVTVSGDEKAQAAREAGADFIINYKTDDVAKAVAEATGGRGAKAMIELDLTHNAAMIPSVLAPHGTVVAYGMSNDTPEIPGRWMLQNNIDLRLFLVYELDAPSRQHAIALIDELTGNGTLHHRVFKALPFTEAVDAHEIVESSPIGNVVINFPA